MSNTKSLRSIMLPTLMTVVVLISTNTLATAQTTPGQPGHGTQGTQGSQGTQLSPMQQPNTIQQQQGGQQGWQWFDDNSTRDMGLTDQSNKELRDMDARYRKEYDAMGETPWTHSNYQDLTERRDADIKRTLTPEQHKQWSNRSANRGTSPSQNQSTPAPKR